MSLRRLFIITGDASGDIHASYVIRRLQQAMPTVEIEAIGGARIAATGVGIFHQQQKMGVLGMGVISAIPSHYFLGQRLLKYFKTWRPDAVLLVDYGMFNLWIAKHLKAMGIKVFYYIPPQVWASRRGRLDKIKRHVDHVFCIFPFEKPLYEAKGIPVTFVGHPLCEQLPPPPDKHLFCQIHGLDPALPIVGVFPGSRRMEIKALLQVMIRALPLIEAKFGHKLQFLLARSAAISDEVFDTAYDPVKFLAEQVGLKILPHHNHEILALSQSALVASGTVTLEAALYHTPVVITYKLSKIAYAFFRKFSYVKYIGLPNLLADDQEAFLPELMMDKANPEALASAILPFLTEETPQRLEAEQRFNQIQNTLGDAPASLNVVKALSFLLDEPMVNPSEASQVMQSTFS